jgi:hypothetical protein
MDPLKKKKNDFKNLPLLHQKYVKLSLMLFVGVYSSVKYNTPTYLN